VENYGPGVESLGALTIGKKDAGDQEKSGDRKEESVAGEC
jgi:hypothetical protein